MTNTIVLRLISDYPSYNAVISLHHMSESTQLLEIKDTSLTYILARFAEEIQAHDNADAVVWKQGAPPQLVGQELLHLFRTDPVSAIRVFQANAPVVLNKKVLSSKERTVLAVGYDALANAFGEVVYCRKNGVSIECPGCGHWRQDSCPCGLTVEFKCCSDRWVGVDTSELLRTDHDRFFLPRQWNNGVPWISQKDLSTKYTKYLEEKSHV